MAVALARQSEGRTERTASWRIAGQARHFDIGPGPDLLIASVVADYAWPAPRVEPAGPSGPPYEARPVPADRRPPGGLRWAPHRDSRSLRQGTAEARRPSG